MNKIIRILKINKIVKLLLVVITTHAYGQDIEIGTAYYAKGEYEKAVHVFQSLKEQSQQIVAYEKHFDALKKLKRWDEAENLAKQLARFHSPDTQYRLDLIDLYQTTGRKDQAEKSQQELWNKVINDDYSVFVMQNHYYKNGDIKKLVEFLERIQNRQTDKTRYAPHLARAYLIDGNKKAMLENLLIYGIGSHNDSYVKSTIQDTIKEDADKNLLEELLYDKIQQNPNEAYYVEILTWHFINEKNFRKAAIQAKALDKRLGLEGQNLMELAEVAQQNGEYKAAIQLLEYVIAEYPDSEFAPVIERQLLYTREKLIKDTYPINKADIEQLIANYMNLLPKTKDKQKALEIERNVAILEGVYLGNYEKATKQLGQTIEKTSGANPGFRDELKLTLGDIYLLKDEPWEASLLYMQVEKSQREEKLGELAKLKTARTYYYTGEFELAKELLDILKKATNREIANDAMQLSLLIQDNLGIDSTDAALKAYAQIDLLIYQNKLEESLERLHILATTCKTSPLADEILWSKAQIYNKMGNVDKEVEVLEELLKNYAFEILADDALYQLAAIYEKKKQNSVEAMKLYRKMLQEYPSSVYAADARKKYRMLRGDAI